MYAVVGVAQHRGMPRPLHLPRVFLGSDAVADGVLTRTQLRGPRVQRLFQGVYAPSSVRRDHRLMVEGARLVLPPEGLVTGVSAATVLGVALALAGDPVQVLVPEGSGFGPRRGVDVRRCLRPVHPGSRWEHVPLAPLWRIAFDAAARCPLPMGVARLDAMARAGLIDIEAVAARLVDVRCKDVRAVRTAVSLVDERSESLPESQTRVHLVLAGIDIETQVPVMLSDGTSVRLDLAVRGRKIGVEYDGAWHALREQLEKDRTRMNALQRDGWVVVHVTAAMLRDPAGLVDALRAAIAGSAPSR